MGTGDDGLPVIFAGCIDDRGLHVLYTNPEIGLNDFIYHFEAKENAGRRNLHLHVAYIIDELTTEKNFTYMAGEYSYSCGLFTPLGNAIALPITN